MYAVYVLNIFASIDFHGIEFERRDSFCYGIWKKNNELKSIENDKKKKKLATYTTHRHTNTHPERFSEL